MTNPMKKIKVNKKPVVAGLPDPNKNVADRYTTQADRIFRKFGNKHRLCIALNEMGYKVNKATVTRWGQPRSKERGLGGNIPTRPMKAITRLSIELGVILEADDFRPTILPEYD